MLPVHVKPAASPLVYLPGRTTEHAEVWAPRAEPHMRGAAPVSFSRAVITHMLLGALVQIDSPAEVGLRVHRAGSSQCRLLPVDISNNGAAVLVTVGKANAPPPYRIENRCGLHS